MKKRTAVMLLIITFIFSSVLSFLFMASPYGTTLYCKLSDKIGGMRNTKFLKLEQIIKANYMGELNEPRMTNEGAIAYVKTVGDKYTAYLDETHYKAFNESLSGGYKGLGMHIGIENGKILVESVKENSPAEKVGIFAGDYLVSLNAVACSVHNVDFVTSTIKGLEVGDKVILGIERDGKFYEKTITVEVFEVKQLFSRMLDEEIGYIRLDTFGTDVAKEFKSALSDLKKSGAKSLVIDLRSNPGGDLNAVVEITDSLVGECTILTVRNNKGAQDVYKSDKNEENMPMCVLIDSKSASASEILASCLKENGKAILLGERTMGKGVVQAIFSLGDETAVKVTIAKYYTSKGNDINGVGVEPDIYLPLSENAVIEDFLKTYPEDNQLLKAIEVLKAK